MEKATRTERTTRRKSLREPKKQETRKFFINFLKEQR